MFCCLNKVIGTTHVGICLLLLISIVSPADAKQKSLRTALIPSGSYKDSEGFALSANLFLYQYGDSTIKPFKWNIIFNIKRSTKGLFASYFYYDHPQAFGANSRFSFYVEYKHYLQDDYNGLGNSPQRKRQFIDPASSAFRDKSYYSFEQRWPSMFIYFQLPGPETHTQHFLSAGFYDRQIFQPGLPNKLWEDHPPGIDGGRTNSFTYGLIYDTRDNEAVPRRGVWSEALAEYAAPALGSNYEYLRLTLTDRRYIPLSPKLVYAHRLVFEPMFGQVPFYDMAMINGSYQRHFGLGGATSMRGIPRLMFVGQHKLLGNFELRYQAVDVTVLKQAFTFFLHTFIDVGRVWLKKEPLSLRDIHYSYGAGLHILWGKDLVAAIDAGRSPFSDLAIYVTFRNLF